MFCFPCPTSSDFLHTRDWYYNIVFYILVDWKTKRLYLLGNITSLSSGNWWIIWAWAKLSAVYNLFWTSRWSFSKWGSNDLCKPVQAESCSVFCSTWTVTYLCKSSFIYFLLHKLYIIMKVIWSPFPDMLCNVVYLFPPFIEDHVGPKRRLPGLAQPCAISWNKPMSIKLIRKSHLSVCLKIVRDGYISISSFLHRYLTLIYAFIKVDYYYCWISGSWWWTH